MFGQPGVNQHQVNLAGEVLTRKELAQTGLQVEEIELQETSAWAGEPVETQTTYSIGTRFVPATDPHYHCRRAASPPSFLSKAACRPPVGPFFSVTCPPGPLGHPPSSRPFSSQVTHGSGPPESID